MQTSLTGRSPSGVTKYISICVFFAMIRFKSFGDVKLPGKKIVILNKLGLHKLTVVRYLWNGNQLGVSLTHGVGNVGK